MFNDKESIEMLMALIGKEAIVSNAQNSDGHRPFAIIPNGCKAEDLTKYFPAQEIQQRVELQDTDSFIAYVNRFKGPETLIFACLEENGAVFTAVLDYHASAPALNPGDCKHVAVLVTRQTPEFSAWLAANRKPMTQVEFATWLEDNLKLFTDPAGAELLELVQTLFGKQDVQFNSAVRLQSGGSNLQFDENVELRGANTVKGGSVELPKELIATIAPFEGAPPYVIRARLKYRIESRKLNLWFETIAKHEIVRHSIMDMVKQISAEEKPGGDLIPGTGIKPILGSAAKI